MQQAVWVQDREKSLNGLPWGPTAWGRKFAKVSNWRISLNDSTLLLTIDAAESRVPIDGSFNLTMKSGLIWSVVDIIVSGRQTQLRGIPNRSAKTLLKRTTAIRDEYVEKVRIRQLGLSFDRHSAEAIGWADAFHAASSRHLSEKGWLTRTFAHFWEAEKPDEALSELLRDPDLTARVAGLPDSARTSLQVWATPVSNLTAELNQSHLQSELIACDTFFDTVESSPLTPEQARAVVCFDERVQVIASAGSGKTSTMIAKAGYALHRGLVPAERILLLAFNAKAAETLQKRTTERLTPLGLDGSRVVAQTFHAFGLSVIGEATGRKPSLAPWLEGGQDFEKLARIIDTLRDTDRGFRLRWDLFRLVFSRDLPDFGKEEDDGEDWDSVRKAAGFRTLNGEIVKSQGERTIADWLFYNGVSYRYETSYQTDTADASHRQYQPDFYYPDIDAYHEHWALDENGMPPEKLIGYLDGVIWKRALHEQEGTTLLETTMAQLWDGEAFDYLALQLTERGIILDPDPDRPITGRPPIDNKQLIRTFRTFLTHAKSNRLDDAGLRKRLMTESTGKFKCRHSLFLQLFSTIREAWEQELASAKCIDFEDMLNQATDLIESGRYRSAFDLVMVDEMQDASHARAGLARALVSGPGKYLFAVGDDWQSINRFAGADISVMTDFAQWFGPGETMRLERTFRFPQALCDISGNFVQKNPHQLRKSVVSSQPEYPTTIVATTVDDKREISSVIRAHLDALNNQRRSGAIPPGRNGKLTVYILGRYRHDEEYVPREHPNARWDQLTVSFLTMHGAKGDEADYVILPGMSTGAFGFPSMIADDPVLRLAMPDGEVFPLAEERRLFYVALTRAKRSVLLVTVKDHESPFLLELVRDHQISMTNSRGERKNTLQCARCDEGVMVERSSKWGKFLGCSRFPQCSNTMKVAHTTGPGRVSPAALD